jgi:hypothetical protein
MSLHYVFFSHGCYLLRHFVDIFEDPPIPLLPQVLDNVNENSIEALAFLLWHLACHVLPPKCRLRLGLAVTAVNHNFSKIAPEPKQLLQRGMIERGVTLSPKGHYTRRNDLGVANPFYEDYRPLELCHA